MKKYSIIFLFLITKLPSFSQSQTKSEQIDAAISALYNNNQFSGSILIAEKGNIIYNKAFGWANFEKNDTLKTNVSMPIASVTKQFTAMGIMILKEKNLLNYDDDIRKYLPKYKTKELRSDIYYTTLLVFPTLMI
jgi:CubicO group peptidase (beta-lactamase class C family)